MSIPTREDINVYDSLDERVACQNFLGKNLDEAEALFRENSLYYQEGLMWMGPVAFRYYLTAIIRYIESDACRGDSMLIFAFVSLLEFKLQYDREELPPVALQLASACDFILEHYGRYAFSPDDLALLSDEYRDVRGRIVEVRDAILRLSQLPERT